MDTLKMSKKERNQIVVFARLATGEITQLTAARMVRLSVRQVQRKIKLYKFDGDKGIIHKSRGRPSKRRFRFSEQVIQIITDMYSDFGPTLISEKLEERHNISVSVETVRSLMKRNNLWFPRKRKQKHRKHRPRKQFFGELIQLDGSDHDWFEGRAPRCTLLVGIDDATSRIVLLQFVPSESTESYMKAVLPYITKYGCPLAFYVDFHSVFSVNAKKENVTQFKRALTQLGISIQHAHSPQAKGRVERANRTFQDRLVKEMRLENICSIEHANRFLQQRYITSHNQKYSLKSKDFVDIHQPVKQRILKNILAYHHERILRNDYTISYQNRVLQLEGKQPVRIYPGTKIKVIHRFDGTISLTVRGFMLKYKYVADRVRRIKNPVEYVRLDNLSNVPFSGKNNGGIHMNI